MEFNFKKCNGSGAKCSSPLEVSVMSAWVLKKDKGLKEKSKEMLHNFCVTKYNHMISHITIYQDYEIPNEYDVKAL